MTSARKGSTLARVHRVRTLQLGLARADEARRLSALADESALQARIAGLAAAVAPIPAAAGANTLAAAAYYRDRLHQSAAVATQRVRMAEEHAIAAAEATRSAHRDQSAVEKLLTRAKVVAAVQEMRALAHSPAGKPKRHDAC